MKRAFSLFGVDFCFSVGPWACNFYPWPALSVWFGTRSSVSVDWLRWHVTLVFGTHEAMESLTKWANESA